MGTGVKNNSQFSRNYYKSANALGMAASFSLLTFVLFWCVFKGGFSTFLIVLLPWFCSVLFVSMFFVLKPNSLLLNRQSLGASFHWGHSGIIAHIKAFPCLTGWKQEVGQAVLSICTDSRPFLFKACDNGTKPTSVPIKMPWCLLIEKRGTAEVSAQLTGWLM